MHRVLCLDGPLNGRYADLVTDGEDYFVPSHPGYVMDSWPNGEPVMIHGRTLAQAIKEAEDHYDEW